MHRECHDFELFVLRLRREVGRVYNLYHLILRILFHRKWVVSLSVDRIRFVDEVYEEEYELPGTYRENTIIL